MSKKTLFIVVFSLIIVLVPSGLWMINIYQSQASKLKGTSEKIAASEPEKSATQILPTSGNPSLITSSPSPKVTPAKTAFNESVAQTVLSFGSPSLVNSSASTLNYSLPVNISTGTNKVTAVQLELQYDPAALTYVAIAPGPFFAKPDVLSNQIDAKTGRITYAFGAGLTGKAIAGEGIVANITFSAKVQTLTNTSITFLPKTLVTAEGINDSILKQTVTNSFFIGK